MYINPVVKSHNLFKINLFTCPEFDTKNTPGGKASLLELREVEISLYCHYSQVHSDTV